MCYSDVITGKGALRHDAKQMYVNTESNCCDLVTGVHTVYQGFLINSNMTQPSAID